MKIYVRTLTLTLLLCLAAAAPAQAKLTLIGTDPVDVAPLSGKPMPDLTKFVVSVGDVPGSISLQAQLASTITVRPPEYHDGLLEVVLGQWDGAGNCAGDVAGSITMDVLLPTGFGGITVKGVSGQGTAYGQMAVDGRNLSIGFASPAIDGRNMTCAQATLSGFVSSSASEPGATYNANCLCWVKRVYVDTTEPAGDRPENGGDGNLGCEGTPVSPTCQTQTLKYRETRRPVGSSKLCVRGTRSSNSSSVSARVKLSYGSYTSQVCLRYTDPNDNTTVREDVCQRRRFKVRRAGYKKLRLVYRDRFRDARVNVSSYVVLRKGKYRFSDSGMQNDEVQLP